MELSSDSFFLAGAAAAAAQAWYSSVSWPTMGWLSAATAAVSTVSSVRLAGGPDRAAGACVPHPPHTPHRQPCSEQWRIVCVRFGTGQQIMVLERGANLTLPRRACSPRYALQSCGGKSTGDAKRPRERSLTRNRKRYDSQLLFMAVTIAALCSIVWYGTQL